MQGRRLRVGPDVDGDALRRVLDALDRRSSRCRAGTKVWLATDHTDMRKRICGLSFLMQEVLGRDPFSGRRSDLIKIVWHDGQGKWLVTTNGVT